MTPTKTSRASVSGATVSRRSDSDQTKRVLHVQRVTSSQEHKDSVARAFRAGREAQTARE